MSYHTVTCQKLIFLAQQNINVGNYFTVIDPYKMELRGTYDMRRWMSLSEPVTAAFFDLKNYEFYLFTGSNYYYIWKINTTLMDRVPLGWVCFTNSNACLFS